MTNWPAHLTYYGGLIKAAKETADYISLIIEHAPEKGRALEQVIQTMLLKILPEKFSLGTGFVITSDKKVSNQIDIVIYDKIQNKPLLLDEGVGIFPIESVYGIIEIKKTLRKKDIKTSSELIKKVREFKSSKIYRTFLNEKNRNNRPIVKSQSFSIDLAPRSYLISFDTPYKKLGNLENAVKKEFFTRKSHIHGLLVLNKGWFISQKAWRNTTKATAGDELAVAQFISALLMQMQSFPMYEADMERYLQDVPGFTDVASDLVDPMHGA